MAVVVLFFSQIIEHLPSATLSAVLIYIAIKIFRVDQMRATRHYSWKAFALMLIALFGTVLLGIVYGVLFAVVDLLRLPGVPHRPPGVAADWADRRREPGCR